MRLLLCLSTCMCSLLYTNMYKQNIQIEMEERGGVAIGLFIQQIYDKYLHIPALSWALKIEL